MQITETNLLLKQLFVYLIIMRRQFFKNFIYSDPVDTRGLATAPDPVGARELAVAPDPVGAKKTQSCSWPSRRQKARSCS